MDIKTKTFSQCTGDVLFGDDYDHHAVTLSEFSVSSGARYAIEFEEISISTTIKCMGKAKHQTNSVFDKINVTFLERSRKKITDEDDSWPLGMYRRRLTDEGENTYELLVFVTHEFLNIVVNSATEGEGELSFCVPKTPIKGKFAYPIMHYDYFTKLP